jgi:hypothetical protein
MSTLLNHREDAFVIGLAGCNQVRENAGELVGRGSDGGGCAEGSGKINIEPTV